MGGPVPQSLSLSLSLYLSLKVYKIGSNVDFLIKKQKKSLDNRRFPGVYQAAETQIGSPSETETALNQVTGAT